MTKLIAEFVGTMILVILGDGVCCNVSLNKSGMKGAGPVHILIGWGMAVMVPAYCFRNSAVRLLKVCSSMHATSRRLGYCSRMAEMVARSFDGAWAKSLYTAQSSVFFTSSSRLLAPLKDWIASSNCSSLIPRALSETSI